MIPILAAATRTLLLLALLACIAAPHVAHARGLVRRRRLALTAGDGSAAVATLSGSHMYIGTAAPTLVKVDLVTFTRVGMATLAVGSSATGVVVAGSFGYTSHASYPGSVSKVDLSTMTEVTPRLELNGQTAAEDDARGLVSDGTYLYTSAIDTPPCIISRITLATFTRPVTNAQLRLATGLDNVQRLVLNDPATFLVACSGTAPDTKCVKITLSTFTAATEVTFSGFEQPKCAVHDATNFLFLGSETSPAQVLKIDTSSTLTQVSLTTLTGFQYALAFVMMPSDSTHIWMVADMTPVQLVQLRRSDLSLAVPASRAATGETAVSIGSCAVVYDLSIYSCIRAQLS